MSDSTEMTLHCLRSIRSRIEPRHEQVEPWSLQDEALSADLMGLDIAIETLAENASLLARLEQAERANDALRVALRQREADELAACAEADELRADRDAWKARAEQAERERDEVKANEAEMQEHIYNYQDHYMREAKRAERAEADGERRMLWLMAVGLEMSCYLAQCSEHSMSEIWHGWLRNKALLALAYMGDERAREYLR